MATAEREAIQPDFGGWGIKEVKASVIRSALRSLKRSGIRGLAVLSAFSCLTVMADKVIGSPLEGALKVMCVLGLGAAILCLALVALLTENKHSATAKQQGGRVSQDQSGTESGDERKTGPAASLNGSAIYDGSH